MRSTKVRNSFVKKQAMLALRELFPHEKDRKRLSRLNSMLGLISSRRSAANFKLAETIEHSRAAIAVQSLIYLPPIMDIDDLKPITSNTPAKPDPNFALSCLFVQLTNLSIGTLNLLEAGLEAPARALYRTTLETSWLCLVLSADEELMKTYTKERQDSEHKIIWQKYFSPTRLSKRLDGIIRDLEISASLNSDGILHRTEKHSFYSHSVHNSFLNSAILAYASEDDSDNMSSSFLGHHSVGIRNICNELNELIFSTVCDFIQIIRIKYNYKVPIESEIWSSLIANLLCVRSTFLELDAITGKGTDVFLKRILGANFTVEALRKSLERL